MRVCCCRRADLVFAPPRIYVERCISEFVSAGRRKFGLDAGDLAAGSAFLQSLLGEVHSLCLEDHDRAIRLAGRYRLRWWDCLLLAVALRTGAQRFLSEDLQDGQVIGGS